MNTSHVMKSEPMSDERLLAELERVTEGLLFMSESDHPFHVFRWEGLAEVTPQYLRGLTKEAGDAPVEVVSIRDFFRAGAKRYAALIRVLTEKLSELKVYRVGVINIPVYIVGKSKAGTWLGVSTRVVET